MKTTKALGALSLGFVLLLGAASAVEADTGASVGDFIVQLAKVKNLNSADPAIARDALAVVGVRVPSDLDATRPLTEGDVSRIARSAGVRVTTSRPDQPFSRLQVERFFTSFQGELSRVDADGTVSRSCDPTVEDCDNPGNGSGPGNGNGGPPFDPFSKGQGQKKGKGKQPLTQVEPF